MCFPESAIWQVSCDGFARFGFIMKSKCIFSAFSASLSFSITPLTPRRCASSSFSFVVVNTVTSAPSAFAIFAARWPRPPVPITPTTLPAFTPQCFIGEYVVTPAHRMGAATSRRRPAAISLGTIGPL